MFRDGVEYRDLGHDDFDRLDRTRTTTRLVRRLQELGHDVELKAAAWQAAREHRPAGGFFLEIVPARDEGTDTAALSSLIEQGEEDTVLDAAPPAPR